MAITPNTQIRLLSVPFEIDNRNQLTFLNKESQTNYFTGLPHLEVESCSYQRKDNIIRFPSHIDKLLNYNYVMYKNNNYSDKWFYAFIDKMEYNNDGLTDIIIKQDVFQTWQFDLEYKKMFVEREHVSSDNIGEHTIPEGLETGEYVVDEIQEYDMREMAYIIQVTEYTTGVVPLAVNFGGVYQAGGAYICENILQVVNILQAFSEKGKADAVYSVYMCPKVFIDNTSESLQYSGQNSPIYEEKTIEKPTTLNGYVPKNKKLLTFPFCFLNVSNNNGTSNSLHYELFNTENCKFNIKGVPTIGASIKCVPYNYANSGEYNNEEEGIMAGKFPTLSWSEDAYINWLTQNSVNIGIGVASNLLTMVGSAFSGNPVVGIGGVISSSVSIANKIGQVYEHSLTPNTAKGNTNGGDINVCSNSNNFYFYKMSIKQEYAKIIDDFFSMFGYKVNAVKIPNITGRTNWNYVKTIDANITGDIPQQDLQEIKDIFNNGVTFWHNPNTFLDYAQNN